MGERSSHWCALWAAYLPRPFLCTRTYKKHWGQFVTKWRMWCLQIASFVRLIIQNLKTAHLLQWTTKKSSKFLHLGSWTQQMFDTSACKMTNNKLIVKRVSRRRPLLHLSPVSCPPFNLTRCPVRCKSTQTCHISLSDHFEKHWIQKIMLYIYSEHFNKHVTMCRNTSASFHTFFTLAHSRCSVPSHHRVPIFSCGRLYCCSIVFP